MAGNGTLILKIGLIILFFSSQLTGNLRSSPITSPPSIIGLPGQFVNIAPNASVSSSSAYSGSFGPSKVIDGKIGQNDSGEWASQGQTAPWLQLNWSSFETINLIKLYDRPNLLDWAQGGILTFSDGSSLAVANIPNDGSVKAIAFPSKTITWVKFSISGTGFNVGLAEIQVFLTANTNANYSFMGKTTSVASKSIASNPSLSLRASIRASSVYSQAGYPDRYAAFRVADSLVSDYNNKTAAFEWASNRELTPWIELNWPTPQPVSLIRLYDRPNPQDQILAGNLIFSDGSIIGVGELPNNGSPKEVTFAAKTITSIKFQVTRASTSSANIGLAEFEVFSQAPGYNTYQYGYAPSIIYQNGKYHMFYCSSGSPGSVDSIRYAESTNGVSWSDPKVILNAVLWNEQTKKGDSAACDPAVVYFDAGDGAGFMYYLFYTGISSNIDCGNPGANHKNDIGSTMFLARSATIDGSNNQPYLKYTSRNTWEQNPADPKIIISPQKPINNCAQYYGAGQESVIAKGGQLYNWYSDDSYDWPLPFTNHRNYIVLRTSSDAKTWSSPIVTNLPAEVASADVKYDVNSQRFVIFYIETNGGKDSDLRVRFSEDGINWTKEEILCDTNCFADYAHNIGVSGDQQGNLVENRVLAIYGAPYDLAQTYKTDCATYTGPQVLLSNSYAPHCGAYWELYSNFIYSTAGSPDCFAIRLRTC